MSKTINGTKIATKNKRNLSHTDPLIAAIINAIFERKGDGVVSLDLSKIDEAVADFFIICEAQSKIQVKAIADHIEEDLADKIGEVVYHRNLSDTWSILDYVNVVVHIFQREERLFYDIEGLWQDAYRREHEEVIVKKIN